MTGSTPVRGRWAKSSAIRAAEPRRNAYGEAIIRPTRTGTSRCSRPSWASSIRSSGSGRSSAGRQRPRAPRLTRSRRDRPALRRSSLVGSEVRRTLAMSSSRRVTVRRLLSCQATTARRTGERNVQIGIGLPNPVLEVPGQPAGGLGQAGRGARLLLAGHHRPDRLPELRLADRPGRGGGRDRADRPGHQHPARAGLHPGAAGQGDRQHRPALGRPLHPRPRGGWPARRLPGGRPVLRRPGPAVRRRPGAAAPGLGGRAGGRQPVPGGPADHPGPHPAADRWAAAAGRAAGGPLGRRLHPRGRPAGDGRRRHQ